MLIKVTNKGEARTVDFLAVFAEGETRTFNQAEIEHYQNMSGVPVFASVLTDENLFDVEALSDEDGEEG